MRTDEPNLPLLSELVALLPNVQHVAVVQKPVQDGRGDDGVAEEFAPLTEALVGSQYDAASLVPGGSSPWGSSKGPAKVQPVFRKSKAERQG